MTSEDFINQITFNEDVKVVELQQALPLGRHKEKVIIHALKYQAPKKASQQLLYEGYC